MVATKVSLSENALGAPEIASPNSFNPLARTAGIASKNEYRSAETRSYPRSLPMATVAPERETPGIRASA